MSEILKGIIPIQKKFMQNNYLFALQWREGFCFGRTIRRRITQYKPWSLIDSNGNVIDIAASTAQAELRFRDPRNTVNSILYLDKTTSVGFPWFYHGAFGIKPQYISMYLRFPEGDIIPGKFPNIDPISPAAGNRISDLNELVSPYEQPTDYQEVVLPPLTEMGAEYYNQDADRNHNPVLNILFCLYWTQIFKPGTNYDNLISRIALRSIPATYLTVGFGDHPQDMGPQMMQDWLGKGEEPLTLDEAAALGGRY